MKKILKLSDINFIRSSSQFYILLAFVFLSHISMAQHSQQLTGFFISDDIKKDTLTYVITPHSENLEILKDTLIIFKISSSANNRVKFNGSIAIRYLSKNKIAIRIPLNPNWKINHEFTDIIPYVAFFYNPFKGLLM